MGKRQAESKVQHDAKRREPAQRPFRVKVLGKVAEVTRGSGGQALDDSTLQRRFG